MTILLQKIQAISVQAYKIVITFLKSWNQYDIPFISAGLTYYTLLAFVPLISLLLTLSTIFINEQFITTELISYVDNLFSPAVASRVEAIILDLVGADYSLALSVGGAVALLYAASSYFARLNQKVHLIITAQQDLGIKNGLKRRGVALFYSLTIFAVIAIISLTQQILGQLVIIFGFDVFKDIFIYVIDPIAIIFSLVVLGALLATFYRSLIQRPRLYRHLLAAGLLVSISLFVINNVLGLALRYSATFQDYGIFSALVSVVIWSFLINTIILSGAIVIRDFVPSYQRL